MKRLTWTQRAVWLALVLALAGSVEHVAWSFTTLEQGNWPGMGYIQALAIDLGLLALALGIQERRRARRRTLLLWVGVAIFSGISAYANLLHGYTHADAVNAPLALARPWILSAVLPGLVLFLAEIAGQDVQTAIAAAERDARKAEKMLGSAPDDAQRPRITIQDVPALPEPAGFTCSHCGEAFEKQTALASHVRWHHPKETQ